MCSLGSPSGCGWQAFSRNTPIFYTDGYENIGDNNILKFFLDVNLFLLVGCIGYSNTL